MKGLMNNLPPDLFYTKQVCCDVCEEVEERGD